MLKYIVCNEGAVLEQEEWDKLSPEEKRVQLYLKQKKMLEDLPGARRHFPGAV